MLAKLVYAMQTVRVFLLTLSIGSLAVVLLYEAHTVLVERVVANVLNPYAVFKDYALVSLTLKPATWAYIGVHRFRLEVIGSHVA